MAVPAAMQAAGFRLIPVRATAREILGERAYPARRDIPEPVELVNIFRPSAEAAGIAVERSRHEVRKVGP